MSENNAHSVIIINKAGLGTTASGDEAFGKSMLEKFLHNLETPEHRPHAIVFYTEGVKTAVEGGGFELALKLLQGLGVELLICQTCLEYYHLDEQKALGTVTGMNRILDVLATADKVITA